jgi:formate hydrogenlyase subunit 6/NADH:ubiquinone oxidoreductase subunit I
LPDAEAICPTQAVVRKNGDEGGQTAASGGERYHIDQGKCVKCDACREQAPYAIAVVDAFGP